MNTVLPPRVPLLDLADVALTFGGVKALTGVSFGVAGGEICGLIGPNGAGKTSLFNCISRLYQPTAGAITFDGADLLTLKPHQVVSRGIVRTFQNLGLFADLTVLDNVALGAKYRSSTNIFSSMVGLPSARREHAAVKDEAVDILTRLDLEHLKDLPASGLPYPTLKRIELARALVARPRLLMLDEPAGGLTHGEVDELGEMIRRIRSEFGITVLLVEHHMGMVMGISDHVVVLDFGRVLAEGSPTEVQANPAVIEAYLGSAA
ncbi:MAG: livG [Aeromicrobium sp.]|jgi:branched-chain amino acid transport system ATP-binding protein|nr:livG [Aeromicrobium sp.]